LSSIFHVYGVAIPSAERGRAVCVLNAGSPLGIAFCYLLAPHLERQFGWRAPLRLAGLAGLPWLAMWLRMEVDPPSTTVSGPGYKPSGGGGDGGDVGVDVGAGFKVPFHEILTTPGFLAIAIAHFAMCWSGYVLMAWLPTYLNEALGVSRGLAFLSPKLGPRIFTGNSARPGPHGAERRTQVKEKDLSLGGLPYLATGLVSVGGGVISIAQRVGLLLVVSRPCGCEWCVGRCAGGPATAIGGSTAERPPGHDLPRFCALGMGNSATCTRPCTRTCFACHGAATQCGLSDRLQRFATSALLMACCAGSVDRRCCCFWLGDSLRRRSLSPC
jgi:hypothetical protein